MEADGSRQTVTVGWTGRFVAPAVWILSWGLVAAGIVCGLLARGDASDASFEIYRAFFWPDALIAGIYGPVSAFVLRRTSHPVGWILAAVALGFGMSALGIQYLYLGVSREDLPAYALIVQLNASSWIVGALAALLVLPWVLDRPPYGLGVRLAAMGGVALTAFAFVTRILTQTPGAPTNPLSPSPQVSQWALDADSWIIPFYFFYGLAGAVYLLIRYRRAPADDRLGLAWVIVSIALVAFSYIGFETGLSVDGPVLSIASAALLAAQIMLAAAILVLVVRQPRWGMDVAVSRATVWGLLTATVVAAYLALVWLAGQILPLHRDELGVVVAALLALAVTPVRRWMQGLVDRLIYGSATDPEVLLARLGTDLSQEGLGHSSLGSIAEGLRHSMRLAFVGVESCVESQRVSAAAGDRGKAVVTLPLLIQGRQVGTMEVSPHHGERLDPRTLRVLEQLSGLVAIALELAQVNEQLDGARTRILDVRHEERRLLRRELHDGLGPALAGASLALAAIGNNNPGIRPEDAELLRQLEDELSRRSSDLRGIARAILPPALDHGRLTDALDVLAKLFGDTRLSVRVEAPDADSIETRRQIAVYHIAAEAVFNAFRHAEARECVVRVGVAPCGQVALEVSDDGRGISAHDQPGIGMTSMRERAAELGGELTVSDSEDGTTIKVVLP